MFNLAKRVIKQIRGDKRTVAMILVAPLLILTLLSLLLGNTSYVPTIAVDKTVPAPIVTQLEKQDATIVTIENEIDKTQYIKNKNADAVFSFNDNAPVIDILEADTKSGKAMSCIKDALSELDPSAKMKINQVYGYTSASLFESMGYIFLGIFAFFLVFIISGTALVRERSTGTLERLLMSQIKRSEVILGYTMGYGVFAVLQAILVSLFAILVLHIPSVGNIFWIILTMVLVAVAAVAFGATVSIFAKTEFQVVQLIPVIIVPQIFFSGIIPVDIIPYGLGNLCYATPIYYGCTALKMVMVEGAGFSTIWPFLGALLCYAFVLCVINTIALKKYRNI